MTLEKEAVVVIVGAGQGGLQAASSLRDEGFEGRIELVGKEPGLPYQRPPLSKKYLIDGDATGLALRPRQFFETKRISYRESCRIFSIDRVAKHIETEQGTLPYDHLILATGSRAIRPPIDGATNGVDLRSLADAKAIRDMMGANSHCTVIGAGFIGLEFSAVARKSGLSVTVLEAADRPMARAVSVETAQELTDYHRALGVNLQFEQTVASIGNKDVVTAHGVVVPTDFVLFATGVRPNVELAMDAGLQIDDGIVTDKQLLTNDTSISALGDCARFDDVRTGKLVRLESVQAAVDHARFIARRLMHENTDPYAAVPWFWSDQGDKKLQIAGLSEATDSSERFNDAVLRTQGDKLTAVETLNDPGVHMLARKFLASSVEPSVVDFCRLVEARRRAKSA